MKNLKINLAIAFACISTVLCAQLQTPTDTLANKQKVREYGIGFTGLNSYSLQFRWGSPKLLYRINANIAATGLTNNNTVTDNGSPSTGNYSTNQNQTKTPFSINTGVGFSILSLKQLNTKFGLMVGGTAGLTYSYTTGQNVQTYNTTGGSWHSTTVKTISQTLQPYIGCVLGAFYKITPSFIIYAEIAPNIFFADNHTTGKTTNQYYPNGPNIGSSDTKTNFSNMGISSFTNSGAMLTLVYRITK